MQTHSIIRVLARLQDRLRFPWRGGALKLNIGSIIPILLLPTLGYVAAQEVTITLAVFSILPICLTYVHSICMKTYSQTKFFFFWTLTSFALIVFIFECPVMITLDIRTEEHLTFVALTLLMFFCGAKTRLTAELSLVNADVKDDNYEVECTVCHKSILPRSFHCFICRSCVIKRDQHCAWWDIFSNLHTN